MKSMPSVMSHSFSQVPQAEIQRSSFDRSFGFKTTFNSGYLIPILVDEALPGDTFNLSMTTFARLATPLVPFMDNVFCDTFFFAVPYRLVWDNWQKFNGEQINPGDSTDYLIPQVNSPVTTGYTTGSLGDYFGLPIGIAENISVSALPFRAYNLIWNEWFRDQNLQDSLTVNTDDGPDDAVDYTLMRRGKRHDYFTSCLPWPQKGPAVTLPLGTSAPVYGPTLTDASGNGYGMFQGFNPSSDTVQSGGIFIENTTNNPVWQGNPSTAGGWTTGNKGPINLATAAQYAADTSGTFSPPFADLTAATAATINALRQAFQIQRLYERDARGGTRYTEIIRAHFGVVSPDARLQRPEYLGGGSTRVNISPIAQTSGTGASGTSTPQGNLAAIGTFSKSNNGFVKSFTEHCIVIGLMSVRADLSYQQCINRMWSRQTRFDFYWPALSHLGEQAVLNQEIFAQGTSADSEVFGYQERYAEYRYKPSLITGLFRSQATDSLDIWHLAQDFASLPTLGDTFIQDNPPISRVVAVDSEPQFLFDSYSRFICARPMPTYSVPGMIDHF